jgi:hypothetical protein
MLRVSRSGPSPHIRVFENFIDELDFVSKLDDKKMPIIRAVLAAIQDREAGDCEKIVATLPGRSVITMLREVEFCATV